MDKHQHNRARHDAISAPICLDLTGLKCPLPVLKARRQITQMNAGNVLEVKADDPAAPLDFEHFCRTAGHELIATRQESAEFTFVIRVGASQPR